MDPRFASEIIRGKTGAWATPEAVALYERSMDADSGSTLLKNTVEPRLIERHVVGRRILDVGIGTGRASLPLAARGLEVTGVDSSQPMLDATRRRAADLPMNLLRGDVTALPFEAESFDSVVSLNVTTHFPHWEQILTEWSRVVRSGGRLVFDMLSADHADAVERATGGPTAARIPDPTGMYQLQVRAAELVPEFDRLGLRIIGIYPYGLVSLTIAATWWLPGTLADGPLWERILSWIALDKQLFDMLLFIEEAIAGQLSTPATGRFMLVLERTADAAANAEWLARNARMSSALEAGFSRASVAPIVGDATWDHWRARMGEFMAQPTNVIALFRLFDVALAWKYPIDLASILPAAAAGEIANLAMRRRAEAAGWQFIERLSADPHLNPLLRPRADIAPSLEFDTLPGLNAHLRGPV